MRLYKFLRGNLTNIIVLSLCSFIVFSYVSIYNSQQALLDENALIIEKKTEQLQLAKDEYDRVVEMEKISNTSEYKENQIRERLNMIKNDEIQFLFSKEN